MTFDDITDDGRLWAVRYDGDEDNALMKIFAQWNDVLWLRNFFKANLNDLISYFRITDVNKAIYDTIEDAEKLQCLIMDISPDADLDKIFRPLENYRTSDLLLGKEKARYHYRGSHKTDCYHAGARTYSSGIAEDGKSSQIPFRREYCG